MHAYLCTYRNLRTLPQDVAATRQANKDDATLNEFLDGYPASFWDAGDDPSFFCAARLLGTVQAATWGVCRPDVRRRVRCGDVVIFICAKEHQERWDYHYVGYGTVGARLSRYQIWNRREYECYREFYNVLARAEGTQLHHLERIFPFHDDWRKRADSGYLLFDPHRSHFDIDTPLHVATWKRGAVPIESWLSNIDRRVAVLERLFFGNKPNGRRLRNAAKRHP